MKFFIDTDIGDDIDDALALEYALEKGCEIVGITTVYREAKKRTTIPKKILSYKGIDNIPVLAGYSEPISREAKIFGEMNYSAPDFEEATNSPDEAIEFMADCAQKYGKELCILALGAQTNIAKAWMKYPEKMKKIGLVAIMGGCFTLSQNEWNIAGDPTAARIVSESRMRLFYVPWNITKDISIGKENYDYILNYHADNPQGYLSDFVRQWKKCNSYIPILHDPAVLICVLNSDMYESKEGYFYVMDSGPASGITLDADNLNLFALQDFPKNKIELVTKTHNEKIADEFMRTVYKKVPVQQYDCLGKFATVRQKTEGE